MLKDLIPSQRDMNSPEFPWLWITEEGTKLSYDAFTKQLKKYAWMAGVPKEKVHCHNFRHYFATQMRKNGVDLDTLKEIMGHESLEMLSTVYDHIDEDDMRRAHQKGSPGTMHRKTPGRKPGKRHKIDVTGFHVDYGDFLGAGA